MKQVVFILDSDKFTKPASFTWIWDASVLMGVLTFNSNGNALVEFSPRGEKAIIRQQDEGTIWKYVE